MTEQEIDILAHKVADILMKRFEEKEAALAEKLMDFYWNTPIKTSHDYSTELTPRARRRLLRL